MELWRIFYNRHTGEELTAYTIRGTARGEEDATRQLLASEKGIDPADIEARTERRL